MKRLVYAPRAYVFIRSTNMGGRIYNVSQDVTSGSVTQNLNDMCTAEFWLRNRFKKWLRDSSTGQLIFQPMDLVTIWLQRLPGQPIQEFTGYLNSVPYYQGYPGDAPFTASCTLKKLAFTWFDPGLQFFQQWLISNGWAYDPTTGEARNPVLNWATNGLESTNNRYATAFADGGFGKLLRNFMVDVGGWNPNDVLVSDLPADLPKAAASLYQKINTDAEKELDSLAQYMNIVMGMKVAHSTTGSSNNDSTAALVADSIRNAASAANVPAIVLAYGACALTSLDPTYSRGPSVGSNWGYGLFALRPPSINSPFDPNDPFAVYGDTIKAGGETYSLKQILDSNAACTAMCALLNGATGADSLRAATAKDDTGAVITWLRAALGRDLPQGDSATTMAQARKFLGTTPTVDNGNGASLPNVDPTTISWNSNDLLKLCVGKEQAVIRDSYKPRTQKWLAALLYQIKSFRPGVRIALPPGAAKLTDVQLYIAGSPADLEALRASLGLDQYVDAVDTTPATADNPSIPLQGLTITQSKQPPKASVTPDPNNAGIAADGSLSWSNLVTLNATSAFAANFAFPADIIEANLLTGEKALMNDMSCLDAVKQFAGASMRAFRSLPDGRFLAFYPDYFGAYRGPYWEVPNIELEDFGIVLNDEQLATHVYVVGDTIEFNDQIDLIEQIGTRGVATFTQADMLKSFIEPWNPGSAEPPLKAAYDFLQHFGARPFKEEQPMIRNAAFEFLYAWGRFMQKWAGQFQTTVSLTYQPEIMAGGIVKFPDHQVQMFVESVTHSWDYASGFETTAVLSAPSIPKGAPRPKLLPGFALAGVKTPGLGGAADS